MMFEDFLVWPFGMFFLGAGAVFGLLFFIFWIWMIVDCIKRKYKNDLEKIIWILIMVFVGLIGAIVYLFAIKLYNPNGIAKK